MPTLLIADASDIFIERVSYACRSDWEIRIAKDGIRAQGLLRDLDPDALLLNLELPGKDGLQVLADSFPRLPPVTLALTASTSEKTFRAAAGLGVGCILPIPARPEYVAARLLDMYAFRSTPPNRMATHLEILGIRPNLSGYRCLLASLELFAKDPACLLKEVYPQAAAQCGIVNAKCVERVIRTAIRDAWNRRDPEVWSRYFSGHRSSPTNKEFIATLVQMTER